MDYIREAVEYLSRYEDWKSSIDRLTEQIISKELDLKCVRESDYSGMPHGSGSEAPDDKIANGIFTVQVLKKNRQLTKRKIDILDKVLNDMPETEKKILQLWFIENHKLRVIEDELGYSKSQLYSIKDKAIRKFSRRLFGIGAAI